MSLYRKHINHVLISVSDGHLPLNTNKCKVFIISFVLVVQPKPFHLKSVLAFKGVSSVKMQATVFYCDGKYMLETIAFVTDAQ